MSDKKKYTPIEVIRAIVDDLKPKIEEDIERLSKASCVALAGGPGIVNLH